MKKFFAQAYLWILLILLYAPILIIVIFSFTESKVLGNWTGFSFGLYQNILSGKVGMSFLKALENTVSIGILAAGNAHGNAVAGLHQFVALYRHDEGGPQLFAVFFDDAAFDHLIGFEFAFHDFSLSISVCGGQLLAADVEHP